MRQYKPEWAVETGGKFSTVTHHCNLQITWISTINNILADYKMSSITKLIHHNPIAILKCVTQTRQSLLSLFIPFLPIHSHSAGPWFSESCCPSCLTEPPLGSLMYTHQGRGRGGGESWLNKGWKCHVNTQIYIYDRDMTLIPKPLS